MVAARPFCEQTPKDHLLHVLSILEENGCTEEQTTCARKHVQETRVCTFLAHPHQNVLYAWGSKEDKKIQSGTLNASSLHKVPWSKEQNTPLRQKARPKNIGSCAQFFNNLCRVLYGPMLMPKFITKSLQLAHSSTSTRLRKQ